MSNEKLILARLSVIDAALECIIKRQSVLSRMIIGQQSCKAHSIDMSEALDDYIAAIEKIQKEYENGDN